VADLVIATTRLGGEPRRGDLLVVGPSLGTSVTALWAEAGTLLGDRFDVVGWDLPGHGGSPVPGSPFSVADLAAAVRDEALTLLEGSPPDRQAWYAGVSLGGAVGLELALAPEPFAGFAVIASGAQIGEPSAWRERAELVRRAGTPVMVEPSSQRWFAPGFIDRQPEVAAGLLSSLHDADREAYALACEALAAFDIRDRLAEVTVPVLVLAGADDPVIPPDHAAATAAALPSGRLEVLAGCGHLPAAEFPDAVARLLSRLITEEGTA
jgi:3-oxoadipate enol-lactonase